jgi:plasmid stabilization system protein ParE
VKRFEISRRAFKDLQEISEFIAKDSIDAAGQVIGDFYEAFHGLVRMPGMGHKRQDLTLREVLFWRVHSYLVIYTNSSPLRIVRVIHGRRDVRKLLRGH